MSLNRCSWVEGNVPNDAVGELMSLINGYNYVGGNPVNRRDHSGMCWVNSSASPSQQSQCYDAWRGYTDLITNTYTQSWPRDVQVLVSQEALYWGNLPYGEFVSQWNSSIPPASTDPGGQVLGIGLPIAGGVSQADSPLPGPADLMAVLAGLCVVGIAVIASTNAVTLPLRPSYSFSGQIYEYRLTGFDAKVGTLAEHLAKVLDREIAGYPRPDPNPENRATRVWCVTIKRVIEEIDNADYSERQLNRDLEAAGISSDTWNIIKKAVKAAATTCEDHWGDFTGGSLAAG